MNYLILAVGLSFHAGQAIAIKKFNLKTAGDNIAPLFFNLFSCILAMIFFVSKAFITNGELALHLPTFLYAIVLGLTYVAATVFYTYTVRFGPLALSALVLAYSLTIPTLYGIFFLGENVSIYAIIGFVLLVASIWLINHKKGKAKITLKWVIFAALTFLMNGICATMQKAHQAAFPGEYQSELMAYGVTIAVVISIVYVAIVTKCKRPAALKPAALLGSANGILNGAYNTCTVFLASRMFASLLYPLLSAGDIVITFLVSFFLFKERYSKMQYIGVVLGVGAIVFLNL